MAKVFSKLRGAMTKKLANLDVLWERMCREDLASSENVAGGGGSAPVGSGAEGPGANRDSAFFDSVPVAEFQKSGCGGESHNNNGEIGAANVTLDEAQVHTYASGGDMDDGTLGGG